MTNSVIKLNLLVSKHQTLFNSLSSIVIVIQYKQEFTKTFYLKHILASQSK